ncbi:TlpA family protein disulfide reductase [Aquabacterium soli]|uniref:TlpA family protein disulfide reductase n=2 Tax=Aquabacterium soli TaxID=2493092 RepID=A0A3R8U495_9BURK|nr:TlpA family protein disulfide reductase [Aquabacterium soli]
MENPSTPSAAPPASPSRRLWVAGGMAALAGLGGGLWWARHREGADSANAPGDPLPADFWSQQFDTVDGPPLKLASFQGKPLVVNFWATWCPPCVKEMPDLDRFHQAHNVRGWHVIGLAIDSATPVKGFLGRTPVHFPIGLAGFGGTELAQALGNGAGALPFTVVIDAQGRIRQRKMGPTHADELSGWAREFG